MLLFGTHHVTVSLDAVHHQRCHQLSGCRFAKQTLETGGNAAATLESADTVYVYDYCHIMRQVADGNAQRHWLLKDIYNGTRGQGEVLLKLYRWGLLRVSLSDRTAIIWQLSRMHLGWPLHYLRPGHDGVAGAM